MPDLRTFEISYTKNGERKTFVEQVDSFNPDDEWLLVVQRFRIPLRDKHADQEAHTWKKLCIETGYTDVTFVELP